MQNQESGGGPGMGGQVGEEGRGSSTLKPSAHLKMEPQPVLGTKSILPHIDVILQSIVRRACKADVPPLKVTAEGEVA